MSLVKVAALFETSLQAKIAPAATTMTLVNGTDKDGNTLSGLYGLVIDEGSANEEFVIGTVAGTSVTAMIRDIDVSNPDVAGTGKDHRRGASVKITDYPFLGQLAKLFTSGGTIESLITFLNTARPKLDSDVDTLNDTEFVTKGELSRTALGALTNNRLVEAGNAGATISAGNLVYLDIADSKWKLADATNPAKCQNVQLGIAQGAGTDGNPISGGVLRRGLDNHQTGLSTGAYYVSNTPGAISSTPGTYEVTIGSYFSATELYFDTRFNQQITEDEQDALAGTSGTPSASNKYVTNDDTAENTASKLVRRKSDGTIDGTKEQIELPAYRNLVAGNILKLINDAGVAKVDKLMGFNGSVINGLATAGGDDIAAKVFEISSNKYLLLYLQNSGSSDIATAVVVSVSGNTLSLGSPANFATGSEIGDVDAIKLEDDKVLIVYTKSSTAPASTTYAVIGTITGTSIAYGSVLTVETTSNNLNSQPSAFKSALSLLEANKALFVFMGRDGSSWVPRATILSISGTTVSANAITSLGGTSYAGYDAISLANLSSTKVVMLLSNAGSWTYAFTISISGTTVTLSDAESLQSFGSNNGNNIIALSDSLALAVYQSTASATTLYYDIISISGTTISIVSQNTITSALAGDFGLSAYLCGNLAYIYSPYDAKVWKFQVSDSSIFLKNVYTLSSLGGVNEITKSLLCFDTANNRLAFFKGYESTTRGLTVQFGYPDYDEFIGLSDATYLAGADVQIKDVVGGQTGLVAGNQYGITYGGAIASYLGTGTYQKIGKAKSSTEMLIAENN